MIMQYFGIQHPHCVRLGGDKRRMKRTRAGDASDKTRTSFNYHFFPLLSRNATAMSNRLLINTSVDDFRSTITCNSPPQSPVDQAPTPKPWRWEKPREIFGCILHLRWASLPVDNASWNLMWTMVLSRHPLSTRASTSTLPIQK